MPDDDRKASAVGVRRLGSRLYCHHARLASSGHERSGRFVVPANRVEGVGKVRSRRASSIILALVATVRMEWTPSSYTPLGKSICVPEILC